MVNNEYLVSAAMGRIPFDVVIENCRLVNVHTYEINDAVIGIKDGYIAYAGFNNEKLRANEYIDAGRKFIIPGLIDAHMHIESTMATPGAFAEGILPHGTTTIVADPHEIANVLGADGVRMMLEASKPLPLNVFMMVPSTVPSIEGMETSGASITASDVAGLIADDRVIGLGEVMDFWGVVNSDEKITGIVNEAKKAGVVIEGHTPVFSGRELQAFVAAGIDSDHTFMDIEKITEKLRAGMCVQIQERFITESLMKHINTLGNFSNILLVTDDVSADRLKKEGHLDALVKKAISCGLDPIKAVRAVTINAARRMRLYDYGSISAGRVADLVMLDSLEEFSVDTVMVRGNIVVKNGSPAVEIKPSVFPKSAYDSIKMNELTEDDFDIKTGTNHGFANVNVVANTQKSYTVREKHDIKVNDGILDISDTDINYMAVFERHGRSGTRNVGLIRGIGVIKGAVATTYSHDCHNLVVIGRNKTDMVMAANRLIEAGGGLCNVADGEVRSEVLLPIAGILSDKSIADISDEITAFSKSLAESGVTHDDPMMVLTIMALAVSPEIKITDLGLVDVLNKKFIDLVNREENVDEQ